MFLVSCSPPTGLTQALKSNRLQLLSSSSLLLFFFCCLGCWRGRSITWLVPPWGWHHFLLQPSDSVLQFAGRGFVLRQQASVAGLHGVQGARHPLHLLLHLFGVGTLSCQLQVRRVDGVSLSRASGLLSLCLWLCDLPPGPEAHPSSESAGLSPPAGF